MCIFVVECFDYEIKIVNVFKFIGIYKREWGFFINGFSYFQNLDLNFNNFHDEVPHDVSHIIMDTFYDTSVVCPEYVIGNHFHF